MTFLWGTTERRSAPLPSAVSCFFFFKLPLHIISWKAHLFSSIFGGTGSVCNHWNVMFLHCILPKLVNRICSKMLNSINNFLSFVREFSLEFWKKQGQCLQPLIAVQLFEYFTVCYLVLVKKMQQYIRKNFIIAANCIECFEFTAPDCPVEIFSLNSHVFVLWEKVFCFSKPWLDNQCTSMQLRCCRYRFLSECDCVELFPLLLDVFKLLNS